MVRERGRKVEAYYFAEFELHWGYSDREIWQAGGNSGLELTREVRARQYRFIATDLRGR